MLSETTVLLTLVVNFFTMVCVDAEDVTVLCRWAWRAVKVTKTVALKWHNTT